MGVYIGGSVWRREPGVEDQRRQRTISSMFLHLADPEKWRASARRGQLSESEVPMIEWRTESADQPDAPPIYHTTGLLTNSGVVFYRLSAFPLEIGTKKVITDLLPQIRQVIRR